MKNFTRIPFLLYTYLATEMLAPFFASFVIMNCVFFLVKLIPFLNFVLELEIAFVDFIRIFSYLFPNMFLYSIPMSAMIGVTIAFSRLSNDTEILAFKASGISVYQILPPVIFVTLSLALLTAYFSIKLIPVSDQAIQQFTYQLLKEKIDKGIKEQQFTEALGDIVVYVDDVDKKTNEWSNVWVSDMRGQKTPTITMAEKGMMNTELETMIITITLENGSLHRPDVLNSQIVSFDKYAIHIPLKTPGANAKFNRGTLTMTQLLNMAQEVGEETHKGRVLITEFHKRLVLPFGCLILALIGLPLGLQAGPGKKAIGIPLGLGVFISYYVAFTFVKMMAVDSSFPIGILMWTPNFLFLLFTATLILRTANELPLIPEPISGLWDKCWNSTKLFIAAFTTSRKRISVPQLETGNFKFMKSRLFRRKPTIQANAKSRVFHLPECEFYECKNCSIEFKNVEIALASNFTPCKFCKSLIDNDLYNKDEFA